MTLAAPVRARTPEIPMPGQSAPFRWRVAHLTARHIELWRRAGDADPIVGPRIRAWRRWRNYRRARRLIDWLAAELPECPNEEAAARAWRRRLGDRIQEFGERCLGWQARDRELLPEDRFVDSTVAFTRRARAFDPELSEEDLGQALRNVWILNTLQVLFGVPVETSPAVFGYSMLYPVTDNFLDDPRVTPEAKRAFNDRLGRRLRGWRPEVRDRRERRVFDLVGAIESHYPRALHPEVYESLLAIHRAQVASLRQQRDARLSDAELLRLSVEKGGTSVLADGYLAAGRLTRAQEEFCFGFGVALQLLDDLQDFEGDRGAGHRTLFSVPGGPLDRRAARLVRFLDPVVESAGRLAACRGARLGELIRGSCLFLLVGAVASAPERFTPAFRRGLERRWPFRIAAMSDLQRRIARHRRALARRGRGRDQLDTLLHVAKSPAAQSPARDGHEPSSQSP